MIELILVGIGQRILVLGLGDSSADGDVLGSLHIKRDALYFGERRLQAVDDLIDAGVALILWLQRNEDAALIQRCRRPTWTHAGSERFDSRVLRCHLE